MLKYLYLSFLILLLLGCSEQENINGYYIGIDENNSPNTHDLFYIGNETFVDYFPGIYTNCRCSKKWELYSIECLEESFKVRIERKNDTLTFHDVTSESAVLSYKKSQASNYLFDYPNDKFEIELPKGKGDVTKFGINYPFKKPLYFFKKEDNLMVNFKNETYLLDEDLRSALVEPENPERRDSYFLSIIAEKSLTLIEMNELFDQLKLTSRLKVDYLLDASEYDEVNYIKSFIKPLTLKEYKKFKHLNFPPPPPLIEPNTEELKEHGVILKLDINNEQALGEFKSAYKSKLSQDSKTMALYHYSDQATYQDLIDFLIAVDNVCLGLRDDYLMINHGEKFSDLSFTNKHLAKEIIAMYPKRIIKIDSDQLKEINH